MKVLVLLLCGVLCAWGQGPAGHSYRCNATANWASSSGCLKADPTNPNTIDIRPCADVTKTCPMAVELGKYENNCTADSPFPQQSAATYNGQYPGDFCTLDTDCTAGQKKCSATRVCLGLASGEECAADADCNPGLFCNETSLLCTNQLQDGATCQRHQQCLMFSGCNMNSCTPFYSVNNGDQVNDCTAANSAPAFLNFPVGTASGMKYSAFCANATCDGNVCTGPIMSENSLPVLCNGKDDTKTCTTTIDGKVQTSTTGCMEGYNANDSYYCQAEINDPPMRNYISWIINTWRPLILGHAEYCNTQYRGISDQCLIRIGGMYTYNQQQMLMKDAFDYPLYVNADACTQQVYRSDYFVPQQTNAFCDTVFSCSNLTFTNTLSCIQETATGNFNIRPCTDTLNPTCPNPVYYTPNAEQNDGYEVLCTQGNTQQPQNPGLLPGDLCTKNSDCLSMECQYEVCVGLEKGVDCINDSDCNPGLFCDSRNNAVHATCAPLLANGTTCSYSAQCAMNCLCNIVPGSSSGTCTQYYGVDKDGSVSDCAAGGKIVNGHSNFVYYSDLCQSGTCSLTSNTPNSNFGTCVPAYKSDGTIPVQCSFNPGNCSTSNGQGQSNTPCSCTTASNDQGPVRYCALDLADDPYIKLMNWVNNYLTGIYSSYNTNQCHTTRRGTDLICMQKVGGTATVMNYTYLFQGAVNYQSIVNAPNCTLPVYQPEYWTALLYQSQVEADNVSAAVALLSTVLVLLAN